jgi:glycerophosphoryl diester phosphodiesterase
MEIIGHRGARRVSPQNTLPSFEVALEAKVPIIEFDTEITSDGKVIIFHDDEVDQITRGEARGPINSFSFEEARKLNVHDGFQDGNFYQIPTLEEVLDLVSKYAGGSQNRTKVNIELKGSNTAGPVAEIVRQYLAKGWEPSDFIVSSFRHDELEKFKQLIPELEIAVLLNGDQWKQLGSAEAAVELAKKLAAVAINPDLNDVNEGLVEAAHQNGFEVNVYTVNEDSDIQRMLAIGVDRIFTDDPVHAQKVLAT